MTLLYSSIWNHVSKTIFFFSISLLLDLVPAIHQDLAMRSQSSDALTLVHHQSQAMVNNMSIGEGSNVFMADASGITIKKKVMQHVSVTGIIQLYFSTIQLLFMSNILTFNI